MRTGPVARQGIDRLCTDLGWTISVDLFASPENSLCARFCTRLHTTLGETADAFTRQSWSSYNCVCGSRHADVVYAFPPDPILLRVWSRLRRDGARGLALVPQWVSAPWWSILRSGLVREMVHIPGSDVGVVTGNGKDGRRAGPDRLGTRSYVLVAFDFAPGKFTFEPHCAQARPRRVCSKEEASERAKYRNSVLCKSHIFWINSTTISKKIVYTKRCVSIGLGLSTNDTNHSKIHIRTSWSPRALQSKVQDLEPRAIGPNGCWQRLQ